MNNILSFNEYNRQELETIVYDNELNEGLRSFFNKRAAKKVRKRLSAEIEMSKSVMDGIKTGLESLNENFEAIRKSLDKTEDKGEKGEKQKLLDSIVEILEKSRKSTWDLNVLIDEGEIDYTGFTANIGTAAFINFGILFTPFRSLIIMHKGYNYFFNIVKDTIRKALVMLQLNFDQFENLIITKSFQSMDYLEDARDLEKISEYNGQMMAMLFNEKSGSMAHKKGWKEMKEKMAAADKIIKTEMQQKKTAQQSENAFNCLDQYNNTYTRSLETLRQYSQDDVNKHLESIKASITKYASSQDNPHLQTFGELVIAAAEEHAYKVSSSIYNKFAKLTEVFSLPNQKKLIDLIQAANKEQQDAATKRTKELVNSEKIKKMEEEKEEAEKKGVEIFNTVEGSKLGEYDEETNKYKSAEAQNWTYEEFEKLNSDDQEAFESWLGIHSEVLEKCDKTLQMAITPVSDGEGGYYDYVDTLIDYVAPCITLKEKEEKVEEAYVILNFDEYVTITEGKTSTTKVSSFGKGTEEWGNNHEKEIRASLRRAEDYENVLNDFFEDKKLSEYEFGDKTKLNALILKISEMSTSKVEGEGDKKKYKEILKNLKKIQKKLKSGETEKESSKKSKKEESAKSPYIDFSDLNDSQIKDLKELFDDSEVAKVAYKVIGKKLLNDNTFRKNAKEIVNNIKDALENKKVKISQITYTNLIDSIKKLKDLRNHDYANTDENKKGEN